MDRPGDAELPEPPSVTACGEPGALSLMVTAAVRDPAADGVNVTDTLQEPETPRLDGQLFDCAKSPALLPVTEMPEIVSAADPLFVIVNPCDALGEPTVTLLKFKLPVLSETEGDPAEPPPVPLRGMFRVTSAEIVTDALRTPLAVGRKVAVIVQLQPEMR